MSESVVRLSLYSASLLFLIPQSEPLTNIVRMIHRGGGGGGGEVCSERCCNKLES